MNVVVNKIREGNVVLKVTGNSREDVLRFCDALQKTYKLMLIGKLIDSDDGGTHCYIDLALDSEVRVGGGSE